MQVVQPLFEGPRRHVRSAPAAPHPLALGFGRLRQDRERARALPPLRDRGRRIESRRRDPLGVQVAVAHQLP